MGASLSAVAKSIYYMIYDTMLGPNTAGLKAQSSEHWTFKISKACVSDTIKIYIRDCHL